MDDSMDIALQLLQYLTLGLIPGGLYGEDDFPPLRFFWTGDYRGRRK